MTDDLIYRNQLINRKRWFLHELTGKLIPDCKKVKINRLPGHRPDAIISIDNDMYVCKVSDPVTHESVIILKKIMHSYGIDRGIIAGNALKTTLPDNIKYLHY